MLDTTIIIPPLSSLDKRTGDLTLNDMVLTSIVQNATISAISSYLFQDAKSINYISGEVKSLGNSLSDYTKLTTFNLSVQTLSTWVEQLNGLVEELSGKAIFYYLNNVSFLKAPADEPTNLCVQFYTSPEMTSMLSVYPATGEASPLGVPVIFDSANEYDSQFIEALLVNNVDGENSSIESKDGFKIYTNDHGTQWKKPVDLNGFGEEYNNAPVNFKLIEWALGKADLSNWVGTFKKNTKLYIKYVWYYTLDDEIHASDTYSQVLPTQTEQTAPRATGDVVSKTVESVVNNVPWNDDIDGFSFEAYDVEPNRVNYLVNGLDDENYDCIYLNDYSSAKEYRIKFTANSTFTIGRESVSIAGNGEYISDFDNYSTVSFTAGKTYLISIQAGMVTTLAQK